MAKVRNISDSPLEFRHAGVNHGAVEPDGVLDVDDKLFDELVWPETLWSVVEKSKTAKPPAGNASVDAWRDYALAQPGVTADDIDGLTRDELRDKFTQ